MGVRGLWEVVAPVAKPVTLESLANKRLAVDASIWIYQFLKAVRDSNGNVLKNAHIIGFFRRICKLLFYGIKPVFVFDGEAPILKKQTIARRNERRLGKQESSSKTAAKLLSVQLQRLAEENSKTDKIKSKTQEIPENVVYFDEVSLPEATRTSKPFKSLDQYHLPDMQTPSHIDENDPRLMTTEELEEYAKEVQSLSSIGLFDTSKIDFNSKEFRDLPKTTQFQLLNVARLRSRLRMGYSADQLSSMFPNRMEFSRFQVDRVAQRNFLTQKILGLVGFEEDLSQRLAGEKGGRYLLKKNDSNSGGGWTLALQNPENDENKIITLDQNDVRKVEEIKEESAESDDEWEAVPIEGSKADETTKMQNFEESNSVSDVMELSGFEENVQRENLYRRLREEQKSKQQEEPEKRPQTEISLASEDELLNKLFPRDSENIRNEKRLDKAPENPFPETVFSSEIPLFAEDSGAIATQKTANSTKRNEDLPPWFSQNVSRQPSDQANKRSIEMEHEARQHSVVDIDEEKVGGKMQSSEEPVVVSETKNLESFGDQTNASNTKQMPSSQSKEAKQVRFEMSSEPVENHTSDESSVGSLVESSVKNSSLDDNVRELDPAELELAEEEEKYEENENDELIENMVKEVEENERFSKTLNKGVAPILDYESEIRNLKRQQKNDQRDADSVTQEMVSECQELLTRFGIPYITAPTEAEAQCASLTELGLVDGIITDDGDCLLFGGKKVYKNMFNQSKFVECYELMDIEQDLGLSRDKLVDLALLLGSDYTDGLPGIGPVTAVELLANFDHDGATLFDFSNWWKGIQRGKKEPETDEFRQKFRKRFSTQLFLPAGFPDPVVKDAYFHPTVDDDSSEFVWGVPDLDSLRTYLVHATGWSLSKANELLVPVIQDINKRLQKHKHLLQTSLRDFGKNNASAREKLEIRGSKRMKRAMGHLIDKAEEEKKRQKR